MARTAAYIATAPGLHALRHSGWLGRGYLGQIVLVASVIAITSLVDLPFDYIRHFVIEEKFGFNRMSKKLFFVDLVKGVLLGIAVGLPNSSRTVVLPRSTTLL